MRNLNLIYAAICFAFGIASLISRPSEEGILALTATPTGEMVQILKGAPIIAKITSINGGNSEITLDSPDCNVFFWISLKENIIVGIANEKLVYWSLLTGKVLNIIDFSRISCKSSGTISLGPRTTGKANPSLVLIEDVAVSQSGDSLYVGTMGRRWEIAESGHSITMYEYSAMDNLDHPTPRFQKLLSDGSILHFEFPETRNNELSVAYIANPNLHEAKKVFSLRDEIVGINEGKNELIILTAKIPTPIDSGPRIMAAHDYATSILDKQCFRVISRLSFDEKPSCWLTVNDGTTFLMVHRTDDSAARILNINKRAAIFSAFIAETPALANSLFSRRTSKICIFDGKLMFITEAGKLASFKLP